MVNIYMSAPSSLLEYAYLVLSELLGNRRKNRMPGREFYSMQFLLMPKWLWNSCFSSGKIIRETFHDTGFGNGFLVMTLKVQETKVKIDKWDYIKLKNFFESKDIIRGERQLMEWRIY